MLGAFMGFGSYSDLPDPRPLKFKLRTIMVPEDQQQRQQKRTKQKKVPQRGLGVAQLEKIRLEEQHKKEAAGGSSSSPCFLLPLPTDISSPESHFNLPNLDLFNLPAPPPPPPPAPPYAPSDFNSQLTTSGLLPHAMWNALDFSPREVPQSEPVFAFRPLWHNDPIAPGPALAPPKKHVPLLQPPQLPSTLNVSSSPSSSSGVNLQIEPPSNQSYSGNLTPWNEEDKMVGMKRPWPFPPDNPISGIPSLPYKLPTFVPAVHGWDESPFGHEAFKFDPGNAISREGPGSSSRPRTLYHDDLTSSMRHDTMEGSFLTLAPPAPLANDKFKQPISSLASHCNESSLLPYQGGVEDTDVQIDGLRQPREQPFYNFLPTDPLCDPATSSERKSKGPESLDLNLKL